MKQRATAIVIAGVMLAAGLSVVPAATAGHTDCHKDFDIAASKLLATNRTLAGGESEIGRAVVPADSVETLHIELLTGNDVLEWTVREKIGTSCVVYEEGGCNGSTPNKITTRTEVTCDLINDGSSSKSFFVEFANPEADQLSYMPWTST